MRIDFEFGSKFFDEICDWLNENVSPSSVYDEETLSAWAEENGYVKENE